MSVPHSYTLEWQSTPQLWVAYRCGCAECPKGMGKTEEAAIADLKEREEERDFI